MEIVRVCPPKVVSFLENPIFLVYPVINTRRTVYKEFADHLIDCAHDYDGKLTVITPTNPKLVLTYQEFTELREENAKWIEGMFEYTLKYGVVVIALARPSDQNYFGHANFTKQIIEKAINAHVNDGAKVVIYVNKFYMLEPELEKKIKQADILCLFDSPKLACGTAIRLLVKKDHTYRKYLIDHYDSRKATPEFIDEEEGETDTSLVN